MLLSLSSALSAATAPVILSGGVADGCLGSPFTFNIIASNSPTSYAATGLPNGININAATGVMSGTPAAFGLFNVLVSATNAGGTDSKAVVLNVHNPAGLSPIITSINLTSGTVGVPLLFAVRAIQNPATFSASGLPAGLSIDFSTGLITGTPTVAGTSNVLLGVSNVHGANATTVTIIISGGTTSTTSASGSASATGTGTGTGTTSGSGSSSATGATTTTGTATATATSTGGTGVLAVPSSGGGKSCGLGGSLGALLFAGLLLHLRQRRS